MGGRAGREPDRARHLHLGLDRRQQEPDQRCAHRFDRAGLTSAALPSKPINQIALLDASEENAHGYVFGKLAEAARLRTGTDDAPAGKEPSAPTADDRAAVSRLGGRQADLEVLVSKVQWGQSVSEAVEDIVMRSAVEIRKNAFADGDAECVLPQFSSFQLMSR